MATFKLNKDADTYEFDTGGKVKKNGANFGAWATDKDNQIVAKAAAGPSVVFSDIVWKFTDNANQLCLRSKDDKEVFNFQKAGDARPFYAVSTKAVLQVFPDENEDFNFELRGKWSLGDDHNLSFAISGVTSTIAGFVDDPKSRFTYFFLDKDKNDFNLAFVGQWTQPRVDNTSAKIQFQYDTEQTGADGNPAPAFFLLPGNITIDRSINQFVYDYDKDQKRRRIKFAGLLNINKDFQITYSIDSQQMDDGSGVAVQATEFRLGAVLSNDKFSSDLEFVLRKTSDGKASKTVIGIRGHFAAQPFGGNVQLGFAFLQVRDGEIKTTTISIGGQVILKNNMTTVQWEFASKDNVKSLTVTLADAVVGAVTINSKVILTAGNGKQRALTFMLGFNF
ncbi:MAG: hypothetical protein AB7U82_10810 [Blastocatellales bacterium]